MESILKFAWLIRGLTNFRDFKSFLIVENIKSKYGNSLELFIATHLPIKEKIKSVMVIFCIPKKTGI